LNDYAQHCIDASRIKNFNACLWRFFPHVAIAKPVPMTKNHRKSIQRVKTIAKAAKKQVSTPKTTSFMHSRARASR
jgi:hypothetical protein